MQCHIGVRNAAADPVVFFIDRMRGHLDCALGFSTSLSQLSASPTSAAAQQGVLSAGQDLAEAFNNTASGLTGAQTDADGQVTQAVSQINTLAKQIAQLNGQLSQSTANGQNGGTIEDQRDELVQQLSTLTGISVTQSNNGETITTGNGTPLVMGEDRVSPCRPQPAATGCNRYSTRTATISPEYDPGRNSGRRRQLRDQTIPGLLTQFEYAGQSVCHGGFNAAQAQGFGSNGNVGQSFFNLPVSPADAAAGMTVALTDPASVAISSDGSAAPAMETLQICPRH